MVAGESIRVQDPQSDPVATVVLDTAPRDPEESTR